MVYQSFLIKYAEIGTKGKNRYLFEDALIKQIKNALKKVEGSFIASKESGRIYVQALSEYDYDEVIEALKQVFGIAWICPMLQLEDKDYENLKKVIITARQPVLGNAKSVCDRLNAFAVLILDRTDLCKTAVPLVQQISHNKRHGRQIDIAAIAFERGRREKPQLHCAVLGQLQQRVRRINMLNLHRVDMQ